MKSFKITSNTLNKEFTFQVKFGVQVVHLKPKINNSKNKFFSVEPHCDVTYCSVQSM